MLVLANAKHEQFAQSVAAGATLTEAAIAAGYSKKSARKLGSRLATKVDIAARIGQLAAAMATVAVAESGIDKAWVMKKLQDNVERAMQAQAVLDPDGAQLGSYKYEGQVANRALELIGKELGMFKEKVDVKHSGAVQTNGVLRVEFVDSPSASTPDSV